MGELSIFIDESGDAAFRSDFYLVTLVFHRQDEPIQPNIAQYECTLTKELLDTIPFHFNPLLNGQDDYKWKDIRSRKRQLHAFRIFAEHLPIAYAAFVFEKRSRVTNTAQLTRAIEADVKGLLRSKQAYLQDFDQVKIYYDDGQSIVTKALHLAIEGAISSQTAVYKDASPKLYRLAQVADYLCGIELTAAKYERHLETRTDVEFFGSIRNFKKNYLKKIRRKRLN